MQKRKSIEYCSFNIWKSDKNRDENVLSFVISAIRGVLWERKKQRKRKREREREGEREKERERERKREKERERERKRENERERERKTEIDTHLFVKWNKLIKLGRFR